MSQRIGCARVSTTGQSLDIQIEKLAGCDKIYKEKVSAASTDGRPELKAALDYVREGDVFVVSRLDRLARSVNDLAEIVRVLEAKKVDLVVIDQAIDTTTPAGRLLSPLSVLPQGFHSLNKSAYYINLFTRVGVTELGDSFSCIADRFSRDLDEVKFIEVKILIRVTKGLQSALKIAQVVI